MRHRRRDQTFLHAAVLAGAAGFLSICASIGLPVYAWVHHDPVSPVAVVLSLWGFAALCGCAAGVYGYLASGDPPQKPPKGGARLSRFQVIDGALSRADEPVQEPERRAA